jgi:hypothetical protein
MEIVHRLPGFHRWSGIKGKIVQNPYVRQLRNIKAHRPENQVFSVDLVDCVVYLL